MEHYLLTYNGKFYNAFWKDYEHRFNIVYDYKLKLPCNGMLPLNLSEAKCRLGFKLNEYVEVIYAPIINEFKKVCTRDTHDPDIYTGALTYEEDLGYWQGYKQESREEKRARLLKEDRCPECERKLMWINLALCCSEHGVQV